MADNRTMAQMLQAPIEGYEDAIVIPPINANNFELKQPLINLVQSATFQIQVLYKQYHFQTQETNPRQLQTRSGVSYIGPPDSTDGGGKGKSLSRSSKYPLILGRPFLRKASCLIDVYEGEITLQGTSTHKKYLDFPIPLLDNILLPLDPMVTFPSLEALSNIDPLPSPDQGDYYPGIQKDLKVVEPKESSLEPKDEIPEVELKELPPHLEYAFLEKNNKLPVIISKDLSQEEKTSLIHVLKNRKQAIAWKLSDIRGIGSKFCSHKILLEDDYQPSDPYIKGS
ncbi:hypothetical protein Tco_0004405 [Tanacetum coccineum]